MLIEQFTDKALSHFSYAIVSDDKMAIVDPSRNPLPYYKFAEKHKAKIVAVFETHPHADFVSSHLQIHKETEATIYVSKKLGAEYPHEGFDDGDKFIMNSVEFSSINTPGHSPDSICIFTKDTKVNNEVLFTGDTLFIGNVGRPDLREDVGNIKATRINLAKMMYNTMQTKFNHLSDDVLVYPAHGAGSLCGKNMSNASSSTLGNERIGNWAFKPQTEEEFVKEILEDQPFIPSYFGFDVDTNKQGAPNILKKIFSVPLHLGIDSIDGDHLVIDTRSEDVFKASQLPNSINIMALNEKQKFETWLGSIVKPNEPFFLLISDLDLYEIMLERIARIGYENQVLAVITLSESFKTKPKPLDLNHFKENENEYTVIDIRNASETSNGLIFKNALTHPLHSLRETVETIPDTKPIVVHCAGGYRSTAGYSIIKNIKPNAEVYDLSFAISDF